MKTSNMNMNLIQLALLIQFYFMVSSHAEDSQCVQRLIDYFTIVTSHFAIYTKIENIRFFWTSDPL